MSPSNGILFNGVLRPKVLNISLASCSFINFDFLLLYKAHFDDNVVFPFLVLVFNTFQLPFSVGFFTLNNMSTCFIMVSIWKVWDWFYLNYVYLVFVLKILIYKPNN